MAELGRKLSVDGYTAGRAYIQQVIAGAKPVSEDLEASVYNVYNEEVKIVLADASRPVIQSNARVSTRPVLESDIPADMVQLPVIDSGVSGGMGDDANDLSHEPKEYRLVPRSLFDDAIGILPVYGNSMTPSYPPGAEVALGTYEKGMGGQWYFEWGEVYAIQLESSPRPVLKRVYESDKEGSITLYSDNTMKHDTGPREGKYFYPPKDIPVSTIVAVYEVIGDCKRRKNKVVMLRNIRENK